MNERIEKLISEAIKAIPDHVDFDLPKEFSEKFAELIVRECLEVLRLVPYDTDREFGDEVIYQDAVKKHFGVE
jgi:hypothetical protein